jgi:transmembrane 9 superfamily protein 3
MNTVGPYHNRQETYSFYTLPFCKGPATVGHHHETLGEALLGTELQFSGLDIKFLAATPSEEFCTVTLDQKALTAFRYAVKHHYWYQMYLDDMPMWALVGDYGEGHTESEEVNEEDAYVWTHKRLDIGVNGNQIVDVNLTTGKRQKLELGATLQFTYQVKWKESSIPFEKRFEKYLDPSFFQHRIHWFSIFNSFMMVLFLVGLVSMILMRTLRKDYARYSRDDELDEIERDLGDEYGWKQIHGDVFRAPPQILLFSALIGTGTVRVFRQKFTLEAAIGSHACSLEANMRVPNGVPLGCPLLLPVGTVNCVQTLKDISW